jgi:two-component system KDP operon response regulator KdpE
MTMSEPNILIADDEPDTLKYLGMNLKARDYKVVTASDGTEALKAFRERPVNLVMLDVTMPGPDGFQVCKKIREESDVPIIMLTAKATESDVVHAFECGADDYLTKPFGVGELLARVGGALRRGPAQAGLNGKVTKFKNVVVDIPARRVWRDGEPVDLTPTELSILSLLIRNKDRVLTHRYILEAVWGNEYSGEKEYVRAYIYRLRRKLERNSDKPDHIVNVSGVGYMFVTDEQPTIL